MNSKLYVGNLAPSVSEDNLRALFSQAGAVTAIELMLDANTGQSRGFAFVTMASPELAAAALNDFHCYQLAGRYITVTEARPPSQQPKGLMSEGFDLGPSAPFRPSHPQPKERRSSNASSRHRHRRR